MRPAAVPVPALLTGRRGAAGQVRVQHGSPPAADLGGQLELPLLSWEATIIVARVQEEEELAVGIAAWWLIHSIRLVAFCFLRPRAVAPVIYLGSLWFGRIDSQLFRHVHYPNDPDAVCVRIMRGEFSCQLFSCSVYLPFTTAPRTTPPF